MRNTITVRLDDELAAWLEEAVRETGTPAGRIVREQLEKARKAAGGRKFLRLAGKIEGSADLSARKGFAKSSYPV